MQTDTEAGTRDESNDGVDDAGDGDSDHAEAGGVDDAGAGDVDDAGAGGRVGTGGSDHAEAVDSDHAEAGGSDHAGVGGVNDAGAGGRAGAGEPVPPDGRDGAPNRAAGAANRRTVLRTVAAAAAATALPGAAVRGAGARGEPAPASTGASSLQSDDGPVCFEPRETGSERSVACKYRLTDAGEDCPDPIYTPCGSTEDPCPFDGTEAEFPESGCSGTLRLSGQFCTTPVDHDVKYWPVPCDGEEPKSVVVTTFLLVGVLRSNPDILVESGSSIPLSGALHGQTVDVVIEGAAGTRAHATVEVGPDGQITDARASEPRDPDYRVTLDEATANDVVAAEQPVGVAKQAYASGRIQVTPLSGGFLQRGVAGVVETVVQVGAGLLPGLGT